MTGLTRDGTIQAPPLRRVNEVAWFQDGPSPGQQGAAVPVGHVDSIRGPAVFYQLRTLRKGDRIDIGRADHSTVIFRVTGVHLYPKDRFPGAKVYGATRVPALRLITCWGSFSLSGRSYSDNLVVFAKAVAVHNRTSRPNRG
jgi:sortase (surface protein transpeptidase)